MRALNPLEALGRVSLYNVVLPGRERLPYGEDSAKSYNLSTYNLPAMFASHVIARPKAADEFRVIVIGDSGTWGWLLDNEDTLAGQINAQNLTTADGKRVVAYNLGYPVMALTKDVLILDEALKYQPDLIVWPVTLESFPRAKQVVSVDRAEQRGARARADRALSVESRSQRSALRRSGFSGQDHRRAAAQSGGLAALAGAGLLVGGHADRSGACPPRSSCANRILRRMSSWQDFKEPTTLTENDLAFDVLGAGLKMAGDVPVLIINEPMFISRGQNSDLRYNSFYPRWAYDQYRELLNEQGRGEQLALSRFVG